MTSTTFRTRYQVLWDNRASRIAGISKEASAAAPQHDPTLLTIPIGQIHSSQNGLHGHVDFEAHDRKAAQSTVRSLRAQGYLGVSFWDTQHNSLSAMFPIR